MNPSNSSETETGTQATLVDQIEMAETTVASNSNSNSLQESTTGNLTRYSGMDIDVFIAAREGNIDALREHRLHLHQMLTPTDNTVLHIYIACVGSATILTKSDEEVLKSTNIVEQIVSMSEPLLLQHNKREDNPLHFAARHGCADIVKALIQASKARDSSDLEKGVSTEGKCWQTLIRTTNKEENTPLHEAVRFNHHSVVKVLITEDPEFLYSANVDGETPVYMAAERGYIELVNEMLDNCTNPAYQGPKGFTALHAAVISNDEEMTRKFLKKERALAQEADELGDTPLHWAASRGHTEIVKQILECDKSTAYVCDKKKRTAFHLAAGRGYVEVIKELISRCPDCCELVDEKGRNGLHYALHGKHHHVEQFIRKDPWLSGVLLNSKDANGNAPLHQIATSLYGGMDFISDSRVDKMAFNKDNLNALDIILKKSKVLPRRKLFIDRLRKTGARRGHRTLSYNDSVIDFKGNNWDGDSIAKEIKESHLLVSTLIATVTFAAGFTVPGGYQSEKGPDQGFAILSRNAAFQAFMITNTLAMSMSSCAVMIRFFMQLRRRELTFRYGPYTAALTMTAYALIAMVIAFLTGTYAVLGGHSSFGLAIAVCVVGCFFLGVVFLVYCAQAFLEGHE